MKIKVGIFFGGGSRHRESSFASGRACFAHLDRYLFEPVPFLVDARGQLLQLDWKLLFQPSLHAFYPPANISPLPDILFRCMRKVCTGCLPRNWTG